jgi:hypothetical protein
MRTEKISVVIRFHDSSQINRLNRCLFSLLPNISLLEIILVVQRFHRREVEMVISLLGKLNIINYKLLNIEDGEEKDLRARLLNVGLRSVDTKLAHFLDYDDVMFAKAYPLISERARSDSYSSGIYFFRVARAFYNIYGDYDFLTCIDTPYKGNSVSELIIDNFAPIHSYVYNAELLARHGLFFDEAYSRLEDYDLLLRTVAVEKANFIDVDKIIGLYNFRNDSSNTTLLDDNNRTIITKEWEESRLRIASVKRRLFGA